MAAPMKRVVGWFGKEEWDSVYTDLFCDDPVAQKHALNRIAVWKSRLVHRLSAGIEITWQLLSACLQDKEVQHRGRLRETDQQLRLAYAMALVRFVNNLTDRGQNRSYAQPVHVLAEELGLPDWLVEMRHEATHSSLPALPLLRSTAQFAVAWIKREYWDAQATDDSSADENTPSKCANVQEDFSQKLVEFMQAQFNYIDNPSIESNKIAKQTVSDLERLITLLKEKSVPILTEEGYLLPTEEQLQALDVDVNSLLNSDVLILPDILVEFWTPVLKLFLNRKLLGKLLHTLAEKLVDQNQTLVRLRVGWIVMIVKDILGYNRSGRVLSKKDNHVDGRSLLQTCLKDPNIYSTRLLQFLSSSMDVGLSIEKLKQMEELLYCYNKDGLHCGIPELLTQDQSSSACNEPQEEDKMKKDIQNSTQNSDEEDMEISNSSNSQTVFSVKSLCQKTSRDDSSRNNETEAGLSLEAWQLATDLVDWGSYPLGECPGSTLTYSSLELTGISCLEHSGKDTGPSPGESEESDEEELTHEEDISVVTQSTTLADKQNKSVDKWALDPQDVYLL